jgi:hypothetical protein
MDMHRKLGLMPGLTHYLLNGQLFSIEQFQYVDEMHICVWHHI